MRAPRNRTLTLAPKELRTLKAKLVPYSSERLIKGFSKPKSNTLLFNDDFLKCIEKLPRQKIDLLILDPPYNLSKDYGRVKFKEMNQDQYQVWFESWFSKLIPSLKSSASVYVCCDWKTSTSVYNVISKYLHVRNRITWEREKGRGAIDNWKNSAEDIWYATRSKSDFYFDVDAVKLKRKVLAPYTKSDGTPKDWEKSASGNFRLTHPSNLWTDISVPFWSMPENTDHPTQKPEKLIAKLILASSKEGDLVMDPFSGSGTTAVVSQKLGRRFLGFEINPEYCAWTLKRLEQAKRDSKIQGYGGGVFWERNSVPQQP